MVLAAAMADGLKTRACGQRGGIFHRRIGPRQHIKADDASVRQEAA